MFARNMIQAKNMAHLVGERPLGSDLSDSNACLASRKTGTSI